MTGRYKRKVARACTACGAAQPRTEAPDPCLGQLPGLINACCGHGNRFFCYTMTGGGQIRRGDLARQKQIELGGHPAKFETDSIKVATWVKAS